MKPARHVLRVATMTVLVLAMAAGALADEVSCRAALSKGHEVYLIAMARAKAKEARGRLPGHTPISPEATAAKIERARQRADIIIQGGCAGVASPDAADPNQCVGLDFTDCLADLVTQSDAIVDGMQAALLPPGPVCLEDPVCDEKGLPQCDPDNGCFCHATVEGGVDCINQFDCGTAQPCSSSSAECPPGQACYVNTCCGFPVCGPAQCQPGGGTPPPGSAKP